MKQLIALAVLPMIAAPAMAAPYVESKTTAAGVITEGGEFSGAQTELRVGYQQEVGTGVTVFGEIGPGYEWNNGGTNEGVAVGEVGVNFPIAENLTGKFKVAGEYGFDSEVFGLGGELKVRYSF
jgi:opacity protein-like surface antigen